MPGDDAASASPRRAAPLTPCFLEAPGQPPIKWDDWLALLEDHFVTFGLESASDKLRLAILRRSLGAEAYRICQELCPDSDSVSFRETADRLAARFEPRPFQIY